VGGTRIVGVFLVRDEDLFVEQAVRNVSSFCDELVFKPRLVGREFDDAFQIRGNVLHCTELDVAGGRASGFLSPPSVSMTKLYNFSIIESWNGNHAQRLHGGNGLRFKPPNEYSRRQLNETHEWSESPFRCLHVCFLRRSSRERARAPGAGRESPGDRYALPRCRAVRLLRHLRSAVATAPASTHKHERYRLGPLVTVSAAPFLEEARASSPSA
jgi:hypothetical protein